MRIFKILGVLSSFLTMTVFFQNCGASFESQVSSNDSQVEASSLAMSRFYESIPRISYEVIGNELHATVSGSGLNEDPLTRVEVRIHRRQAACYFPPTANSQANRTETLEALGRSTCPEGSRNTYKYGIKGQGSPKNYMDFLISRQSHQTGDSITFKMNADSLDIRREDTFEVRFLLVGPGQCSIADSLPVIGNGEMFEIEKIGQYPRQNTQTDNTGCRFKAFSWNKRARALDLFPNL